MNDKENVYLKTRARVDALLRALNIHALITWDNMLKVNKSWVMSIGLSLKFEHK